MSRGKLSFLIAPARSGKSTFAAEWITEEDKDGLPRVVISDDQIRLALHGERYNRLAEPAVYATKYIILRTLVNSGYHVLSDDTHTTKESIERLLEIDKSATPIFIDTPYEVCLERAVNTNQFDLILVIGRMFENIRKLCARAYMSLPGYPAYFTDDGEVEINEYLVLRAVELIRRGVFDNGT